MLVRITSDAPWLSRDLAGSLRASLERWKQFENANGDCATVKVDAGRYMSDDAPASVSAQVYRERMERGKAVIRAIAENKVFVGWEKAMRATARRATE